ncbi:MAG TPA: glucose-1-phosphate thymidylyltransferase [Nanoarchaeota archaeon]|nr:glucose-1-phosphate thymidylyltransferase [Nanoarchaeota archaeon]
MLDLITTRTDPKYFFRQADSLDFPEIFEVEHIWQALAKKDDLLRQKVTGRQVADSAQINSLAHIIGPVHIGKDTVIKPFTYIEATDKAPIYIGKNCEIGPYAYIRKGTLIGNNVELRGTAVKGSILHDGVMSHHHGYIGDSILGYKVNIATSFDSGNLKHTHKKISVGGIDTGLIKFGCVIGDYSKTGCKTTTAPGTLIGPNVWLDEGFHVGGFIPENTLRRRLPNGDFADSVLAEKYRNLGTLLE